MKIALSYTAISVFTIFRKRKISKKNKKYSKGFTFKLILFLVSIITFNCFSTTTNVEIKNKYPFNFYGLDSLKQSKDYLSNKSELDTDEDGVLDILDLDDDNDGILDSDEGFQNLYSMRNKGLIITMNGAWVLVETSVYIDLPTDLIHGTEFWIPFMGSQYVKAVKIKFENTENGIRFTQTAAKHTVGNNPDLDTNLDYDFDNGGITAPIAISNTDEGYGIARIEFQDKVIISDYLNNTGQVWESSILDTDNDGFINSRDTDSDNDGCPDASEGNNNIATSATLSNGSNGGSLENLGSSSNKNGIPLPLGTMDGDEITGQSNTDNTILSEQLIVSPLEDLSVKTGDNVILEVNASAMKTSTFNLGVPNYSVTYGTDVSDLIQYKWYREDDVNIILSTSKTLVFNDVKTSNSGNYIVEVKGSGNTCIVKESIALKVDNILGEIEKFDIISNKIFVYPNPTQGDVNLSLLSNTNTEADITLFDITGKEIFSTPQKFTIGKNEINFNVNVKPGILFLKIRSKEIDYGITKIVFK